MGGGVVAKLLFVFKLLLFELFTIDDEDRDASSADVDDDDDEDDDGFDVELGDEEDDDDAVTAVVVVEYGVDKELKMRILKINIYIF